MQTTEMYTRADPSVKLEARIDFLAHFRAFVVGLEGFADFFAVGHEIENKGVFLQGMNAVETRQGLYGSPR